MSDLCANIWHFTPLDALEHYRKKNTERTYIDVLFVVLWTELVELDKQLPQHGQLKHMDTSELENVLLALTKLKADAHMFCLSWRSWGWYDLMMGGMKNAMFIGRLEELYDQCIRE